MSQLTTFDSHVDSVHGRGDGHIAWLKAGGFGAQGLGRAVLLLAVVDGGFQTDQKKITRNQMICGKAFFLVESRFCCDTNILLKL